MACAALDLSVLDDVRQVNDRQCFIAARRLAREEGIFGGGSAGAAVHVALQIAKEAGPGKVVVAILPDGGRAYISKFYSDEWMRDMGFLERIPRCPRGTVQTNRRLSWRRGESTRQVVLRMQKHGFSQLPIVNGQGRAVGMVHESDVLGSLLSGDRNLDQPIEPAALQGVVSLRTPIHEVEKVLADDNVAVVIEDGRVIGIVTKIDLITHLANPPR